MVSRDSYGKSTTALAGSPPAVDAKRLLLVMEYARTQCGGSQFTTRMANQSSYSCFVMVEVLARRTIVEVLPHFENLVRAQLPVDKLVEPHQDVAAVHEPLPSECWTGDRAYSSSLFRKMRRPRKSRDITVPSGMSSISAISL